MNSRKRFTLLVGFIFSLCESSAQILVYGRLLESGTENAVPFASLRVTNSFVGTASDEEGDFVLNVAPEFNAEKIVISSLGYQNRYIPIDSLRKRPEKEITIYLQPFIEYLDEVVITGIRPGPAELLNEAIDAIPENYSQQPFNLEFYSKLAVTDSLHSPYEVESILVTYRKGYVAGSSNWSRILQKRERGKSPFPPERDKKTKREYFSYFPTFDVTLVDQIGVGKGAGYTVFNPKKFNKMDFAYAGTSVFDRDTVCAIEYSLHSKDVKDASAEIDGRYNGVIYVALNNLAIIRHTLKIGRNRYDIIYRNVGGYYFPYSIQTYYPASVYNKNYRIIHTISLRRIVLENVEVIEPDPHDWRPENVEFDKEYWDGNYPATNFDDYR